MNKNILVGYVDLGFSQRTIANKLKISQTAIRYWINKFQLVRKKICKYCGTPGKYCCEKCKSKKYVLRWIRIKKRAIAYKGGKCGNCGYSKYYGALEFHHKDPTTKDVEWTYLKKRAWNSITLELDKCELLCANCHREFHAGVM